MATRKKTSSPQTLKSFNPRTGKVLGEVPANSPGEVKDLVEQARKVAPEWAAIAPEGRVRILREVRYRTYDLLDDIVDTVSEETGKPKTEALVTDALTVIVALWYFERVTAKTLRPARPTPILGPLIAGMKARVEYQPFGVVGAITPWNYPMQLGMAAVAPALFAGNAVVIKPSEVTPRVGECIRRILEPVPSGVATVIQGGGDVGQALIDAPVDKLCFIGSPATGRKVAEAAAKHLTPVVMELGGMDPAIVLEDADLDRASSAVLWGGFFNAGQTCAASERLYVVDSVADEFTDLLLQKLSRLRSGGPDADVGPLTLKKQLDIVRRHVDDAVEKGANVLAGGPNKAPANEDGELWYVPTVLDGITDEMDLANEESFGPILPIVRVRDAEEALRRANQEGFNLTGSVFSRDRQRARNLARRLRAGSVGINEIGMASNGMPWVPWGGIGESGYGRVNGEYGLREFTYPLAIVDKITKTPSPYWYPYTEPTARYFRAAAAMFAERELPKRIAGMIEAARSMGAAAKSKF